MGRRVAETVQVRPVNDELGCRPEVFIWKGRLYVVREVLSHWCERRPWWRDALEVSEAHSEPGQALERAAMERQVWRVEASPGWSFAPGVYDLALTGGGNGGASATGVHEDAWALVQVED